jgi:hypothetical protein
MDYFQDLLTLQPGEAWRARLFSEIDRCDVFLLFWSRSARNSRWVIEEAEYALRRSKSVVERHLEIIPVLLEGPPPVMPPNTLEEIHFNDSLRHIIFAEEATAKARQDIRDRFEWVTQSWRDHALL